MSWRWFIPAAKQPVPAHGLRVDRFGSTWWGEQWIAALQKMGAGYSNRLPRGRSYAREGRVVDVSIAAGEVSAGVVGSRRRPYQVVLQLGTFSEEQWQEVVEVLAGEALFTIALLRRELPPEVGQRLAERGLALFPAGRLDLSTTCSCPDWANPCKHVAAVHYVVAAALDSDPFLIFHLRGLERQSLLSALAAARGAAEPDEPSAVGDREQEQQWQEPESMDEAAYLGTEDEWPELSFDLRPPDVDLAGLRRLGPPPVSLQGLPGLLAPAIRRAGRAALKLAAAEERQAAGPGDGEALAEKPAGSAPAEQRATPRAGSPRQLRSRVLALLQNERLPVPMGELVRRLGVPAHRLRPLLNELRSSGTVAMEGSRRSAAYRLAKDK